MVRAPRLRVLRDGEELPGVLGATVSSPGHPAAARFRVRLAGRTAGDLAEAPIEVQAGDMRAGDVQAGTDGWTSLVLGRADSVRADPLRGVIDIEGRDLAAPVIEARAGELFPNRTASEIAAVIAGRHGLEADIADTATPVGRYYGGDHTRLAGPFTPSCTEWDLLAGLAQAEGFGLGVSGGTLWFGPRPDAPPVEVPVGGCVSAVLEHQVALSRGVEMTVESWGTRDARTVVARAGHGAVKQRVIRPNLRPDQAQALADRALADLVRHERTAVLMMPGELEIGVRSLVRLSGAGPDWDRVYAVASLTRRIDTAHGFTQELRLGGVA